MNNFLPKLKRNEEFYFAILRQYKRNPSNRCSLVKDKLYMNSQLYNINSQRLEPLKHINTQTRMPANRIIKVSIIKLVVKIAHRDILTIQVHIDSVHSERHQQINQELNSKQVHHSKMQANVTVISLVQTKPPSNPNPTYRTAIITCKTSGVNNVYWKSHVDRK